ncbi:hypothetical protein [uncultured Clostridium sp.]|uniref:hypothetical protein n=1 Tax=uncultured Clostridium sp. TaxID=59620 RepID=UPI0026034789|nr:hypothetical protein [uncultured Clostridium sp.]
MINLINGDLYRLFRTKAYRNCIIATIVIIIVNIVMDGLWLISFTDLEGMRYGFYVGVGKGQYIDLLKNSMGTGAVMYIVGVCLTASITVGKWDSGSLKNIVSFGYERWKIFLSNILAITIGISILVIAQFLIVLGIKMIIFKPIDTDLILTIKVLISYIVILGAGIGIYTVIASIIPSQSVIGVIVIIEIFSLSMIGHLIKESTANFIPFLTLRKLAGIPEGVNLLAVVITMVLLSGITVDIGRMIFNKVEIK